MKKESLVVICKIIVCFLTLEATGIPELVVVPACVERPVEVG